MNLDHLRDCDLPRNGVNLRDGNHDDDHPRHIGHHVDPLVDLDQRWRVSFL